jgi:parallel beta-helix repeat protein
MKTILTLSIIAVVFAQIRLAAEIIHVDATATGGADGTSWANAYTTLRDGLAAAVSGDQIWVAEGVYYPDQGVGAVNNDRNSSFRLINNVTLYGGFSGTETQLAQRNIRDKKTILSGDLAGNDILSVGLANTSENAYHVVYSPDANQALVDGFTITAGNANGPANTDDIFDFTVLRDNAGGGLYCDGNDTFINCTFQGNNAGDMGGGIYISYNHYPTFINCVIQGNKAKNGGGINNAWYVGAEFINCSIQGNLATENGGGIAGFGTSHSLINCIIWNNIALAASATHSNSSSNEYINLISHCLIEHLNPIGFNEIANLDGTNPANNPLFLYIINPAEAPTTLGDLGLRVESPALNVGDDAANTSLTDLRGRLRKFGTIDLGAYEGALTTFVRAGFSNPNGDDNNNGVSNFVEYAAGYNPTILGFKPIMTAFASDDGRHITLRLRNNAADVSSEMQKSLTLKPDSWTNMVEGVDFMVEQDLIDDEQSVLTLKLLTPEPKIFFRQSFHEVNNP